MAGNAISVVVGVDGSDDAVRAAQWAATLTAKLGGTLHLVYVMRAVDEALLTITDPQQADAGAYPRELGHEVLDRVADRVQTDWPALHIVRTLRRHPVVEVLEDLSRDAHLVVLACDDVSPGGALLTGSTTLTVATRSACPVVAWRGDTVAPTQAPIVVGVDDDGGAHCALETAFGLADLLGVGLTVVHATLARRAPGEINLPGIVDWERLESEALQELSVTVAPVASRWPHVMVAYVVDTGKASRVILDHAAGAQLIVVGSRGRGAVASAVLGSTGLGLLHHAQIPVLLCPSSTQ